MFSQTCRSLGTVLGGSLVGMGDLHSTSSLRRVSSMKRSFVSGTAAVKKKSLCLQVKFQMVGGAWLGCGRCCLAGLWWVVLGWVLVGCGEWCLVGLWWVVFFARFLVAWTDWWSVGCLLGTKVPSAIQNIAKTFP